MRFWILQYSKKAPQLYRLSHSMNSGRAAKGNELAGAFSLLFSGTRYAVAMFVHTFITVDPTTQIAFGHDIAGVAFVVLITGGTHKLHIFSLGHFQISRHHLSQFITMLFSMYNHRTCLIQYNRDPINVNRGLKQTLFLLERLLLLSI